LQLLTQIRRILSRVIQPDDPQRDRTYVPMLSSGMTVTHDTALQFSAVFRAVAYISSQLAMMPWRVMTDNNGNKEIAENSSVDRLIHLRPNREMSAFVFRETLIQHALTWGNGYAEIERDLANRPIALWPLSPDRVEVKRNDLGEVVYEISGHSGPVKTLSSDKVFHLHGMGFDGLVGYSVINLARRAVGLGIAAEQMGSSFFENGLITNLKIEHPEKLGEQAYKNLKDSLSNWLKGPKKSFNPLIIEEGMKASTMSMPLDDAQFLETRQFQVEEIARWYGLPPHKLQSLEKATFSNIEQQSIEVVNDALLPWAVRLEQEANFKLFAVRAKQNLGVFSVNEIRELEDMNPVQYGDKRFVQLNMTTLEKAGEDPVMPEPVIEEEEDEDEDIEVIANKIVRREMFRLHDAAKRYEGDRDGFVSWMVSFFTQHEEYCVKAYLELSIDVSRIISARIPDARLKMLEHFDTGCDYPVAVIANELKEAVYGHNQSQRVSN